jgi:cytosine/adenosine deaminase-related metal-dependent hydrolase
VVPDPASSIDDGAVLVRGDRVARVGRFPDLSREPARVLDLGETALLPGLVNAHCHLDLTGARGRFAPTADFLGWILGILPLRDGLRPGVAAAAEEGARELLASGCTLVADMVREPAALEGIRRSGIRAVTFYEILGRRSDARFAAFEGLLDDPAPAPAEGTTTPGLGAHAPYTCAPDLLARCADLARRRRWPVSIHASESSAEQEWTVRGEGPFADPLRAFFGPEWTSPRKTPLRHLRDAGFLGEPRLLAHGNFLDREEMAMARDGGHVVVHCPGSHAFFSHGRHPVEDLLGAGVPVAIGTDSLASHPDGVLSIPGELRRLAARVPSLPPRELLAMATVNGAEGMGLAGLAGVLAPGSFADAAAFDAPGGWKGPESLLDPGLRCTAAFVGGVARPRPKGAANRA